MQRSDKIVNYLLRNPFEDNSINKISAATGISVGGTFNILKKMKLTGIASSKSVGRSTIYSLNFSNAEARKLMELVLLRDSNQINPLSRVLKKDLVKVNAANVLLLFGSVLTKKNPADIDILIIAEKKALNKVRKDLKEVSKMHTKVISPLILTPEDFQKNIRKQDAVIMEILRNGKVIKGESDFVKMVGEAVEY